MGLSFDELNMMTMDDYLVFVDMWVGEDEDAPKQATQADIKRYLG